jgi:hypothetical protein
MTKLSLKSIFLVGSIFAAASASAGYTSVTGSGSLTFDDLGNSTAPIADGYQGLNWSNFNYMNAPWSNTAPGYGGPNGYDTVANADSPPNVATNPGGGTAAFWTDNLANFINVDFSIGSVSQDNLSITIAGYEYNGSSLGSVLQTLTVDLANPFTVYRENLNWTDVNYIQFSVSAAGTQNAAVPFSAGTSFAIDEVPEPGQAALLLIGLPLLAMVSRRRTAVAA